MKKKDVDVLGGMANFARIIEVSPSRATQIFYPKEKGGREGNLTYYQAKKILKVSDKFTLEYLMGDD